MSTDELPEDLRAQIQRVQATEGIYIVTDTAWPGYMTVFYSYEGQIWSLKQDAVLDPERFIPTIRFHGPYLPAEPGEDSARNPPLL